MAQLAVTVALAVMVVRAVSRVPGPTSLMVVPVVTPVPVVPVAMARRTARSGPSVVLAVMVVLLAPRVLVAPAVTGVQAATPGRPLMVALAGMVAPAVRAVWSRPVWSRPSLPLNRAALAG